MSHSFFDLGVSALVCDRLARLDISVPTEIQEQCIPAALDGRDVLGQAPTGSGKTLAFALPIVDRLAASKPLRDPRALILAPTRELANQIGRDLRSVAGRDLWVTAVYGGAPYGPQLQAFRRGCDVAVATPGRLEDLLERGALRLDAVEIVVVDEVDRMADMGFAPALGRILNLVPSSVQSLLFSATFDESVERVVRRIQHDPVRVSVASGEAEGSVSHSFERVASQGRVDRVAELVTEHGSTIIFCNTRHVVEAVQTQLARAGVDSVRVHGGRSQKQREAAISRFSGRRVPALVATDVAARGIHVDDVALVLHYDLPKSYTDYLHRSGRTGRAGRDGAVVALVRDRDAALAKRIERDLRRGGDQVAL